MRNALRLALAAAALGTVLVPGTASAGICTIRWRDHNVAGHTVQTPYCIW